MFSLATQGKNSYTHALTGFPVVVQTLASGGNCALFASAGVTHNRPAFNLFLRQDVMPFCCWPNAYRYPLDDLCSSKGNERKNQTISSHKPSLKNIFKYRALQSVKALLNISSAESVGSNEVKYNDVDFFLDEKLTSITNVHNNEIESSPLSFSKVKKNAKNYDAQSISTKKVLNYLSSPSNEFLLKKLPDELHFLSNAETASENSLEAFNFDRQISGNSREKNSSESEIGVFEDKNYAFCFELQNKFTQIFFNKILAQSQKISNFIESDVNFSDIKKEIREVLRDLDKELKNSNFLILSDENSLFNQNVYQQPLVQFLNFYKMFYLNSKKFNSTKVIDQKIKDSTESLIIKLCGLVAGPKQTEEITLLIENFAEEVFCFERKINNFYRNVIVGSKIFVDSKESFSDYFKRQNDFISKVGLKT